MFDPILEVSTNFAKKWFVFLEECDEDEDLPLHLIFGDFAQYIAYLINSNELNAQIELRAIFLIIEQWLIEGDKYVKDAATGFFETLQNPDYVSVEITEKVEIYLLIESKRCWDVIHNFLINEELDFE